MFNTAGLAPAQGDTGMDRIRIVGGEKLRGTIPISGAKKRRPAADDRQPAHPRPADAEERPQPCRRQPPRPHPAQPRRRPCRRRQTSRSRPAHRRDVPPFRARHRRYGSPLRDGLAHARQLLGARPVARPLRPGQGLAARRLRHRHAPRRPASDGPQGARRRDRDRGRLRYRQGQGRRAARRTRGVPQGVGRRHPQRAARLRARPRGDGHRERRPRAGDRRRRRVPRQDGRQDRRHRHLDAAHPGCRPPRRRRAFRARRPYRDRHLRHGRGGRRRRRDAGGRAPGPAQDGARCARQDGRYGADDQTAASASPGTATASSRSRWRRSPSPASRPTCRRSSWR